MARDALDLALISDTHVPGRESEIPSWVCERIRAADHTIHAGDFDAPETLDRIRTMAAGLTAVTGNIDPPTVDLPSVATVETAEAIFVVVHGTGPHESWPERVADVVHETVDVDDWSTVVGVGGHTHTPTDVTVGGVRLLNPGSATGARPATRTTTCSVHVDGAALDVEFHET